MDKKKNNITFGIPSYNSSLEILNLTVQSIIKSVDLLGIQQLRILICLNGKPNRKIEKLYRNNPNIKVIYTPNFAKGKSRAINEIHLQTQTELLIIIDDDVLIDSMSLSLLIEQIQSKNTYITFPSRSLINETHLNPFNKLLWKIFNIQYCSNLYNGNDPFFTGMCFCVKTKFLPMLPNDLINDDQFLQIYFMNNSKLIRKAFVYYRGVHEIRDYINRFFRINYGRNQIKKYFRKEIYESYNIQHKRILDYGKILRLPIGNLICFLIYRIAYTTIRTIFNLLPKTNYSWERSSQIID
ncbi:MAG: hypothetical protein UU73_C0001G0070 [Candidatus Daviesbacteria bacterium GW2011_GWA1_41_61]|uniref:Glycosyltransferase 2-like domain-containing protein n=1 Tax=Candidatus Daviesbacteria bacterium GW2011_GWA2_40_9 TaxID=1618424 RepID=A0A0G0X5N8_9BACT|nr:MAG: hypothetical protein UU26_C0002G0033 [Candidatus Daviesbacteria bacterium GW2011_GWC1_40_9]KKR82962.1 MAG: hypothetical protein UU29_C0008G0071 [Candidatus Daviesbacteria bacterium GW2011_GWA2_40_9]KKR92889.1 MAG: hypothetical protein UU44_C0004G0071 [Candidatus Daviesbacteria bacterium GW2011_GWB1_41_15]KKS15433.1 MAG: hypothetical protein UU73_C0001G0070 [Candidatus Daviesbacteria bacterium GW2011_GWA1_41_61]